MPLSVCDLRKTARGASSPAKPALHIPELCEMDVSLFVHGSTSLTKAFTSVADVAVEVGQLFELGGGPPVEVWAYPLSMTRAATSSVCWQHG